MNRRLITFTVFILSLIKGYSQEENIAKNKASVLEAEWVGLDLWQNGVKGKVFEILIFRDGLVYASVGAEAPRKLGKYTVDDSKEPKEVDFEFGFGQQTKIFPAIYRTVGEKIELCHPLGKKRVRPEKFDKVEGVVVVLLGPNKGEQGSARQDGSADRVPSAGAAGDLP